MGAVGREWIDGCLHLTLDTPDSPVNIFNHEAAAAVSDVLADPAVSSAVAVVIRSAKEGSFVNGVGLMLASTVHSVEDAFRLTEQTREAYRAIRECPVPTVAAIAGNCYGCGVELALQCDFRLAMDSRDTHFYMTEMADYLFIPAFGGTQNLPPLVGLARAAELVLWGKRWSAREAKRFGLVDAVAAPGAFERLVSRFVKRRGLTKRVSRPVPRRGNLRPTVAAIRDLPPVYRPLYTECLGLMESASRGPTGELGYRRELNASAGSVLKEPAKAALGFFFSRQTAAAVVQRGREAEILAVAAGCAPDPRLAAWRRELKAALPRGVRWLGEGGKKTDRETLYWFCTSGRKGRLPRGSTAVAVVTRGPGGGEPAPECPTFYRPSPAVVRNVIEITMSQAGTGVIAPLHRWLARVGFSPVVTWAEGRFLTDEYFAAFAAPLVAWIFDGGDSAAVENALAEFGYVRRPKHLMAKWEPSAEFCELLRLRLPERWAKADAANIRSAWKRLSKPGGSARAGSGIPEAVAVGLLHVTLDALKSRAAAHPATVDLLARDLLDFPLRHGGFCRWMRRDQAGACIGAFGRGEALVPESSLDAASRFARQGRDFYG